MKLPPSFLFLLLLVSASCRNRTGQSQVLNFGPKSELARVHPFLSEGDYEIEYYQNKDFTEKQVDLFSQIVEIIGKYPATEEYFRKFETGVYPRYDPGMRINKKQYNALKDFYEDINHPKKQTGTLTVTNINGNFRFDAGNDLVRLDSLRFTDNGFAVHYQDYDLSRIPDSLDFEFEHIPPGDKLVTYHYFEGPTGLLGATGLEGFYGVLLGKLSPSNKIYLSLVIKKPSLPGMNFIYLIMNKK